MAFPDILLRTVTMSLLCTKMQEAVEYVRNGNGPVLVESVTYRWFGHSTSDPGKYRTKEEVDSWKRKILF